MTEAKKKDEESLTRRVGVHTLVVVRLAVYIFIFGCSIAILHGISTSMRDSSVLGHQRCLLSAKFGERRAAYRPDGTRTSALGYLLSLEGGDPNGCNFVIFVGCLQLVLSLALTGVVVLRVVRGEAAS